MTADQSGGRYIDRAFIYVNLILPTRFFMLLRSRDSIHYSPGPTGNVPTLVEDGNFPLNDDITVSTQTVHGSILYRLWIIARWSFVLERKTLLDQRPKADDPVFTVFADFAAENCGF